MDRAERLQDPDDVDHSNVSRISHVQRDELTIRNARTILRSISYSIELIRIENELRPKRVATHWALNSSTC